MRNEFIYPSSIKVWGPGCDEIWDSVLSSFLIDEELSLQEAVEMLEEVVVCR